MENEGIKLHNRVHLIENYGTFFNADVIEAHYKWVVRYACIISQQCNVLYHAWCVESREPTETGGNILLNSGSAGIQLEA